MEFMGWGYHWFMVAISCVKVLKLTSQYFCVVKVTGAVSLTMTMRMTFYVALALVITVSRVASLTDGKANKREKFMLL